MLAKRIETLSNSPCALRIDRFASNPPMLKDPFEISGDVSRDEWAITARREQKLIELELMVLKKASLNYPLNFAEREMLRSVEA